MSHVTKGQFQVKFLRMNEGVFFWIFGVKNMNLTYVKHYSPLWGRFLEFWDHFIRFFIYFVLSQTFLNNAMFRNLLRFCLTSKHLENKLNYQKHINFYEIHPKKFKKKNSQHFWNS